MEKKYVLIHQSEGEGISVTFLDDDNLEQLLDNPRDCASVDRFADKVPAWTDDLEDGQALLLKFELLVPKEKTKAFFLERD